MVSGIGIRVLQEMYVGWKEMELVGAGGVGTTKLSRREKAGSSCGPIRCHHNSSFLQ